jgi:hypothetical protein
VASSSPTSGPVLSDTAERGKPSGSESPISLLPSELQQLVAEQVEQHVAKVAPAGTALPPGAYYGPDGGIFRDVPARTGRVREVKAPDGRLLRREAVVRTVTRSVMLITDPSPGGVVQTLRAAKLKANEHGPDVYHPRFRDWFRGGAKREHDLPENLSDEMAGPITFVPITDDPESSVIEAEVSGLETKEQSNGE